MAVSFNADEVFEMAEEIERNGEKFYKQAAQHASNENIRKLLIEMSKMEHNHLEIFQDMRKGLSENEKEFNTFDPDNEAMLYLQTMAASRGYEGKINLLKPLTGTESIEEVLDAAVGAEKNSVIFYVGLKEMVSALAGRNKIDAIIKEEMGHLMMLNQAKSELNKAQ